MQFVSSKFSWGVALLECSSFASFMLRQVVLRAERPVFRFTCSFTCQCQVGLKPNISPRAPVLVSGADSSERQSVSVVETVGDIPLYYNDL